MLTETYYCTLGLLTLKFIFVVAFQPDIVEYDGHLSIKLQHAFDQVQEPQYFDRGTVQIQSIRTGAVSLQQSPLSGEDKQKLKCSLAESHLSDILTVSLDHTGAVIAVSMSTSPAVCEGHYITLENLKHFNTTVFVKHMEQGPVPDTAAYIQKLEKEREARERGETKDNRSFLAKYWMYIVPVVIFVVLSGAANPEGGAGAGGGGAGR
ncbi:ER membrane protein complex subunit 10 [Blattella germanica]|nr:ER membrane protein complex subunit 10 [Blattella germanica]